jgi:hypothetical protein
MNAKRNPALASGAKQNKKRNRQSFNHSYFSKKYDSEILNTYAWRWPQLVITMILRSKL